MQHFHVRAWYGEREVDEVELQAGDSFLLNFTWA